MKKFINKCLFLIMLIGLVPATGYAKAKRKKVSKRSSYLDTLSKKFRKGLITEKVMWESLSSYSSKIKKISGESKVRLLQTQSDLLQIHSVCLAHLLR